MKFLLAFLFSLYFIIPVQSNAATLESLPPGPCCHLIEHLDPGAILALLQTSKTIRTQVSSAFFEKHFRTTFQKLLREEYVPLSTQEQLVAFLNCHPEQKARVLKDCVEKAKVRGYLFVPFIYTSNPRHGRRIGFFGFANTLISEWPFGAPSKGLFMPSNDFFIDLFRKYSPVNPDRGGDWVARMRASSGRELFVHPEASPAQLEDLANRLRNGHTRLSDYLALEETEAGHADSTSGAPRKRGRPDLEEEVDDGAASAAGGGAATQAPPGQTWQQRLLPSYTPRIVVTTAQLSSPVVFSDLTRIFTAHPDYVLVIDIEANDPPEDEDEDEDDELNNSFDLSSLRGHIPRSVKRIALSDSSDRVEILQGTFPPELADTLEVVDLSGNSVLRCFGDDSPYSAASPGILEGFTRLKVVCLRACGFLESLGPRSLRNTPLLKVLDLRDCPAFEKLYPDALTGSGIPLPEHPESAFLTRTVGSVDGSGGGTA